MCTYVRDAHTLRPAPVAVEGTHTRNARASRYISAGKETRSPREARDTYASTCEYMHVYVYQTRARHGRDGRADACVRTNTLADGLYLLWSLTCLLTYLLTHCSGSLCSVD